MPTSGISLPVRGSFWVGVEVLVVSVVVVVLGVVVVVSVLGGVVVVVSVLAAVVDEGFWSMELGFRRSLLAGCGSRCNEGPGAEVVGPWA